MKLIKSILNDCKSWDKIVINKWHLHAPIAFIIGWGLFWLLGDRITDIFIFSKVFLKIFVPSFIGYAGLWLFEAWQKRGRIIGELEMFESKKDLWVGEFFLILCVILTYIIL